MKNKLRISGTIVIAIGFAISLYLVVMAYTTPNYNLASTSKPPYWVNLLPFLLLPVGLLLISLGRRQSRQNPPKTNTES